MCYYQKKTRKEMLEIRGLASQECNVYHTDMIVSGRLVFIGGDPQHQTHSLQKQRLVFHLKLCQLLAISYYNGVTRYGVEHPFPPSPEEKRKGQQELYPASDNNTSWIHWPHSMQAEKYLFIFKKSFSVALPYLVNSWTGRMIPRPSPPPPSPPPCRISASDNIQREKKITNTNPPTQVSVLIGAWNSNQKTIKSSLS